MFVFSCPVADQLICNHFQFLFGWVNIVIDWLIGWLMAGSPSPPPMKLRLNNWSKIDRSFTLRLLNGDWTCATSQVMFDLWWRLIRTLIDWVIDWLMLIIWWNSQVSSPGFILKDWLSGRLVDQLIVSLGWMNQNTNRIVSQATDLMIWITMNQSSKPSLQLSDVIPWPCVRWHSTKTKLHKFCWKTWFLDNMLIHIRCLMRGLFDDIWLVDWLIGLVMQCREIQHYLNYHTWCRPNHSVVDWLVDDLLDSQQWIMNWLIGELID